MTLHSGRDPVLRVCSSLDPMSNVSMISQLVVTLDLDNTKRDSCKNLTQFSSTQALHLSRHNQDLVGLKVDNMTCQGQESTWMTVLSEQLALQLEERQAQEKICNLSVWKQRDSARTTLFHQVQAHTNYQTPARSRTQRMTLLATNRPQKRVTETVLE